MLLRSLQAATNDNTNVYWKLLQNATLTGGTWVDHPDPNSFMQYNITQTAVSGGTVMRDLSRDISDARDAVKEAQKDLADAKKGPAGAADAFADAMSKLSPEAQRFVKYLISIQGEFRKLSRWKPWKKLSKCREGKIYKEKILN